MNVAISIKRDYDTERLCKLQGARGEMMKKKVVVLLGVMMFTISGCANSAVEKVSLSEDYVAKTQQDENMEEELSAMEEKLIKMEEKLAKMEEELQIAKSENVEADVSTSEAPELTLEQETNREYVTIQNPSEEYYIAETVSSDTKPYTLTLVEKKQNEITDDEKWFEKNGLEKQFGDEAFSHDFWPYGGTYLVLHGPDKISELDFSEFQYSSEYKEEDYDFIAQSVTHTYVENNILYVETGHWTYAESAPKTAYITAIDLTDYHVIWKSQPLVCNSRDFTIVGDVIFCGYGFTDEDDYLYQLDKKTGVVLAKEPLKSAPDHIIYQDNKLYIRTYNTDYVYEVK